MWTALAGDVTIVEVMPKESCWVVPRPDRVSSDQTSLWAESGILVELLGAIAALDVEHEVVVADVAAGGIV